ncbi:uncharacterized protein V1516DRAFT_678815 [Lipomyces oligophaga]|uniref:uncharacterized protein n=1 Tax=Lipomyces oligophaga TaxID=45792 RepID=UPI0034CD58C7
MFSSIKSTPAFLGLGSRSLCRTQLVCRMYGTKRSKATTKQGRKPKTAEIGSNNDGSEWDYLLKDPSDSRRTRFEEKQKEVRRSSTGMALREIGAFDRTFDELANQQSKKGARGKKTDKFTSIEDYRVRDASKSNEKELLFYGPTSREIRAQTLGWARGNNSNATSKTQSATGWIRQYRLAAQRSVGNERPFHETFYGDARSRHKRFEDAQRQKNEWESHISNDGVSEWVRFEELKAVKSEMRESPSDLHMLELAEVKIFRPFRKSIDDRDMLTSQDNSEAGEVATLKNQILNYPELLLAAMKTMVEVFHNVPGALIILDRARELGVESYLYGFTAPVYNYALEATWECMRDLTTCRNLLEEMSENYVKMDMETIKIIKRIETELEREFDKVDDEDNASLPLRVQSKEIEDMNAYRNLAFL